MSEPVELIGGKALQATWETGAEDEPYDWDELTDSERQYWIDWMADALAALGEAGYEIFRPDEHKQALVEKFNETTGLIDQTVAVAPGRYWLVPVEGED